MYDLFCAKCGQKVQGGYCSACKRNTLVAIPSFERGIDIPKVPLSFTPIDPESEGFRFRANHAIHTAGMPVQTDTPFGNLHLISSNLIQDIEHLNKRIQEAFESYAVGMYYDFTHPISSHQRIVEEVIYWMKRVADRLISLHWILNKRVSSDSYPTNIEIDNIGKLIQSRGNEAHFSAIYSDESIAFLDFLNNAANAYKHSLINGESPSLRIGQEEPLVIALHSERNNSSGKQHYVHDSLANTVVRFSIFYKEVREEIKTLVDEGS